jgi:hypothetical protein
VPRTATVASTVLSAEHSRRELLRNTASVLVGSLLFVNQQPATAASYGSFGASPTAVIDPKDAEVDYEVLGSKQVQGAIQKIQGYQSTVTKMISSLEADEQINVQSIIIKELDFANLRESFNIYNTAFEEDTQRGTDRLIRVIMQDITELEVANRQKDGIPRSPRRVETMRGKLLKLDQAMTDLLAYAK